MGYQVPVLTYLSIFFFFKNFFLMWAILKIIIEFVTILLLLFMFSFRWPVRELSSPTRKCTCTLCIGRQSFNHWTTGEVPRPYSFCSKILALNQVCVCLLSHFSHVRLFSTAWTVACQAPLSMGILPTRILEWVTIPSSRGSSLPRDQTRVFHISCTGRWV